MIKTIITGGAGFIGFHLAKYLLNLGHQVDLVDIFSRGVRDQAFEEILNHPSVRLFEIDLCHPDALDLLDNDYNYIYHLAAIIGVANVNKHPYKVLSDNIMMLINLLKFSRNQTRLEKLVFSSTSEVYAGTLKHFKLPIPTPENTPLALTNLSENRTAYLLSKIYGEALCSHSGIPFTIIRPHNIYGPRMGLSHVIPELLKKAHFADAKSQLEIFSTQHRRTFCYVDDAVKMIHILAESEGGLGQTFNIGNQEPELTMAQVGELIINITGLKLSIKPLESMNDSPVRRCPDMSKTYELSKYTSKIDIETGINLTYTWYKNNIFNEKDLSAK